jgi:hypothetical protein
MVLRSVCGVFPLLVFIRCLASMQLMMLVSFSPVAVMKVSMSVSPARSSASASEPSREAPRHVQSVTQLGRPGFVLFDDFDLDVFAHQFGHPEAHQPAAQDHHPVPSLLFDPGQGHQFWEVLLGCHDQYLVLGKDLMIAAGQNGGNPLAMATTRKGNVLWVMERVFSFWWAREESFVDTGGHDLCLAVGDVDDLVSGRSFDQPNDFLGRQFFRMNDQIDFQVIGAEHGIFGRQIQWSEPGRF